MKSSYLRAGAALACALALSACGGSSGELYIGGSIAGLTKDGLVLQYNGAHDLPVTANSLSFIFPDLVPTDSDYEVTVLSSPSNASCAVTNGTGNTGAFNVTSVQVTCTTHTHALKGTVSGVSADGLVVVNGSDKVVIPAGATGFEMAKVAEESPYGIKILTQPAGLNCTIHNGIGTMGTADVTNVAISCYPAA